jgi:hypothetical protein
MTAITESELISPFAVHGCAPPCRFYSPGSHQPGQDAEVDFGDVYIDLAGVRTLC